MYVANGREVNRKEMEARVEDHSNSEEILRKYSDFGEFLEKVIGEERVNEGG